MPRGLQHDRLMRVSHSHVAATARDDSQENQILALRLMQHPATYSDWESRHSQLMKQVCEPTGLRQQIIRMRATTLSLVHRRAVFEFLRDSKITGEKRRRFIAVFYGPRDYASAMLIEHGHYVRSWVSASCSCFIGAEVLHDPAYAAPLTAYEQCYGEYFRMFCHVQISSADEADGPAFQRALLPVLKERADEAREQLLNIEYSHWH